MTQFSKFQKWTSGFVLLAFTSTGVLPHTASANDLKQDLAQEAVALYSKGLKLAQKSKNAIDIIDFAYEDLEDAEVAVFLDKLKGVQVTDLPTAKVIGSRVVFEKDNKEVAEVDIRNAEEGRFRINKKEFLMNDDMSFEEFFKKISDANVVSKTKLLSEYIFDAIIPSANALSMGAKIAIGVGIVAAIALVVLLIKKNKDKKKKKKAEEEKRAAKKADQEAKKAMNEEFRSTKKQYDSARDEFIGRCGHYPDGFQVWAIAGHGATKDKKTAAMKEALPKLAATPCDTQVAPESH